MVQRSLSAPTWESNKVLPHFKKPQSRLLPPTVTQSQHEFDGPAAQLGPATVSETYSLHVYHSQNAPPPLRSLRSHFTSV
ncbi:unnamed protein product [Dicrocoelium dendriticum]|nr:unnamed protein product [Dicrocoelium dendriticum]